jgi:hypothetical protein
MTIIGRYHLSGSGLANLSIVLWIPRVGEEVGPGPKGGLP